MSFLSFNDYLFEWVAIILGLFYFIAPYLRKYSTMAIFSLITIRLSTFLGVSRFLFAFTMLPPVLKIRSDLAEEAGRQRILLAREVSKCSTASCCFHQCRMLTFFCQDKWLYEWRMWKTKQNLKPNFHFFLTMRKIMYYTTLWIWQF